MPKDIIIKNLDLASKIAFLLWGILRLSFHMASGNAVWSGIWGLGVMLSLLSVIVHIW